LCLGLFVALAAAVDSTGGDPELVREAVGDDGGEMGMGTAADSGDNRPGGIGAEPVRHSNVAEVE
jgi:hypothetical protein